MCDKKTEATIVELKPAAICVVRYLGERSAEEVRQLLERMRAHVKIPVIAIGDDISLESLTDEDLKRIGLKRINQDS